MFPLRATPSATRADLRRVARNRAVLCTETAPVLVWVLWSAGIAEFLAGAAVWALVLLYQWARFEMLRDGAPFDQIMGVQRLYK